VGLRVQLEGNQNGGFPAFLVIEEGEAVVESEEVHGAKQSWAADLAVNSCGRERGCEKKKKSERREGQQERERSISEKQQGQRREASREKKGQARGQQEKGGGRGGAEGRARSRQASSGTREQGLMTYETMAGQSGTTCEICFGRQAGRAVPRLEWQKKVPVDENKEKNKLKKTTGKGVQSMAVITSRRRWEQGRSRGLDGERDVNL
jgi:hypothetical protein